MVPFVEPEMGVLYIVTFLAVFAICLLWFLAARSSSNNLGGNRDLQVALLTRRVEEDGFVYVKVPIPSSLLLKLRDSSPQANALPCPSQGSTPINHKYPYTPYLTACWKGDYAAMKDFLASGADPREKTHDGSTGLVLCVYQMTKGNIPWKPKCLKLLLNEGCPIDEPTKDNNTALHFAVKASCFNTVKWLVQHGAGIHVKNSAGWTPHQIAKVKGVQEIIDFMNDYNVYRELEFTKEESRAKTKQRA